MFGYVPLSDWRLIERNRSRQAARAEAAMGKVSMNTTESMRDAGTCLGGFLGMFLGAMLGFTICMKFLYEKVSRNDGTVHSNQALLPFLGVLAAACAGAVTGAMMVRLVLAAYTKVFSSKR